MVVKVVRPCSEQKCNCACDISQPKDAEKLRFRMERVMGWLTENSLNQIGLVSWYEGRQKISSKRAMSAKREKAHASRTHVNL